MKVLRVERTKSKVALQFTSLTDLTTFRTNYNYSTGQTYESLEQWEKPVYELFFTIQVTSYDGNTLRLIDLESWSENDSKKRELYYLSGAGAVTLMSQINSGTIECLWHTKKGLEFKWVFTIQKQGNSVYLTPYETISHQLDH